MKINKTLFEMYLGILFWGILCQAVGAFLVENQLIYAESLWFGILLAGVSATHMYRSLDRALDYGDKASKLIFRDYLIRYILLVVIMALIMVTKVLNPLVVFLAYMGLKVSALIQPFTDKLCNKLEKFKKGR